MIRFALLIPFKPKAESANWEEDNRLLNRTICSVLQQSYPHFKVFVLYTDVPKLQVADPRIEYVTFPYGFLSWEELPNREELFTKFKSKQKTVRRWDKGRKLSYAAKLAKEEGYDYLMALDSDDLLSKQFLAYLFSRAFKGECAGWYVDKGYLYKEGSVFLQIVPRHMTGLNGSTHVLRSDLVRVPDFNSLDWGDYNLFTDHGWIRYRVQEEYGVLLEAIPKPMLIYVVHTSNMSGVCQKEFGSHWKAIVKRLFRTVLLTAKHRDEFNIHRQPLGI